MWGSREWERERSEWRSGGQAKLKRRLCMSHHSHTPVSLLSSSSHPTPAACSFPLRPPLPISLLAARAWLDDHSRDVHTVSRAPPRPVPRRSLQKCFRHLLLQLRLGLLPPSENSTPSPHPHLLLSSLKEPWRPHYPPRIPAPGIPHQRARFRRGTPRILTPSTVCAGAVKFKVSQQLRQRSPQRGRL